MIGARTRIAAVAAALVLPAALPAFAVAGGPVSPPPQGSLIEAMNGVRFPAPVPEGLPLETNEVRFAVDGVVVQSNDFPPFTEPLSTRRLTRRGVTPDKVHSLTVSAVPFFEAPVVIGQYELVIRSLPVIRRPRFLPLIQRNRTRIVGFQLRGLIGERVRAWGRGFRFQPGNRPLPLQLVKAGKESRTYRVPGGLEWSRGSRPRLIFNFSPPEGRSEYGYPVRGRILIGVLRTNRAGDTVLRRTDRWRFCSEELSRRSRPPRRVSCEYI